MKKYIEFALKNMPVIAMGLLLVLIMIVKFFPGRNKPDTMSGSEQTFSGVTTTETSATIEEQAATPVPLSDYDISQSQKKMLEKESAEAFSCCRDIYAEIAQGETINKVLSSGDIYNIMNTLANNGYTVTDYFGNYDMMNPQNLVEFGERVRYGISAVGSFFVVHEDGRVHRSIITYDKEQSSITNISMEFTDDLEVRVYSTTSAELSDVQYTDKGRLICTRPDGNLSVFTRLTTYDPEFRRLQEKYLDPIGYGGNNLFTTNWSSSAWATLDFNSLYPFLHGMYYGVDPLIYSTATTVAGFNQVLDTRLHLVPYEQFERVVSQYFNIQGSALRMYADNREDYDGYFMLGNSSDLHKTTNSNPEPEITEVRKNGDGSITLFVDAVWREHSTDRAFSHMVTIMENGNGFKYVSNTVTSVGDNLFPDLSIISMRKSYEAELP